MKLNGHQVWNNGEDELLCMIHWQLDEVWTTAGNTFISTDGGRTSPVVVSEHIGGGVLVGGCGMRLIGRALPPSVSNSQHRSRDEGWQENPGRPSTAQLASTIRRAGDFQEEHWSRWQRRQINGEENDDGGNLLCTLERKSVVPRSG